VDLNILWVGLLASALFAGGFTFYRFSLGKSGDIRREVIMALAGTCVAAFIVATGYIVVSRPTLSTVRKDLISYCPGTKDKLRLWSLSSFMSYVSESLTIAISFLSNWNFLCIQPIVEQDNHLGVRQFEIDNHYYPNPASFLISQFFGILSDIN
jgi:hypothetical protein